MSANACTSCCSQVSLASSRYSFKTKQNKFSKYRESQLCLVAESSPLPPAELRARIKRQIKAAAWFVAGRKCRDRVQWQSHQRFQCTREKGTNHKPVFSLGHPCKERICGVTVYCTTFETMINAARWARFQISGKMWRSSAWRKLRQPPCDVSTAVKSQ